MPDEVNCFRYELIASYDYDRSDNYSDLDVALWALSKIDPKPAPLR